LVAQQIFVKLNIISKKPAVLVTIIFWSGQYTRLWTSSAFFIWSYWICTLLYGFLNVYHIFMVSENKYESYRKAG